METWIWKFCAQFPHLWKLKCLYFPSKDCEDSVRIVKIQWNNIPESASSAQKIYIPHFFLFLLASSRDTEPLDEAGCIPDSGPKGFHMVKVFFGAKNAKVYFMCWRMEPHCCPCSLRLLSMLYTDPLMFPVLFSNTVICLLLAD